MAFVSWATELVAAKEAFSAWLAAGSPGTKSYTVMGRSHTFRDVSDWEKLFQFLNNRIAEESGGAPENSTAYLSTHGWSN